MHRYLKGEFAHNNLAIIEENKQKAIYELGDVVGSQKEAQRKYKQHQHCKAESIGQIPLSPESNTSLYEAIDYWKGKSDCNKAQKAKFVSCRKTVVKVPSKKCLLILAV